MNKTESTELFTRISASDKVLILPCEDKEQQEFDQNSRINAINWFNLKSSFFYNLYSLLAVRYVRKASGKLIFKGKLITQLEGDTDTSRKNLLIVSYPDPTYFLKLVGYKVFQFISIFRLMGVKQFCFGFTKNLMPSHQENNHRFTFNTEQTYLVYHFQGEKSEFHHHSKDLIKAAGQHHAGIYFCGMTVAKLVREKSGHRQAADFFMDGIVLVAAESQQDLDSFKENDAFQSFKKQHTNNALYLFSRTH